MFYVECVVRLKTYEMYCLFTLIFLYIASLGGGHE